MYRYTPDEIGYERVNHRAEAQDRKNLNVKRIGNFGELAFEQFCHEYLPAELWEWKSEEAMRRCSPESLSSYDFEVFGYKVNAKTSHDVSAFLPETLLDNDLDDDIIVMVWHRDNEDGLILLGWERTETLKPKAASQERYSSEAPERLDHLAARPMNEFIDLGPNATYMNQKPENPFSPGDHVKEKGDRDVSVAIVVEVLPPKQNTGVCGMKMEGGVVSVAFSSSLDEGPGNWEMIHPALYASYCYDQNIRLYTYGHSDLEFTEDEQLRLGRRRTLGVASSE